MVWSLAVRGRVGANARRYFSARAARRVRGLANLDPFPLPLVCAVRVPSY